MARAFLAWLKYSWREHRPVAAWEVDMVIASLNRAAKHLHPLGAHQACEDFGWMALHVEGEWLDYRDGGFA